VVRVAVPCLQMGRAGASPDYRADFYTVGALLYQLTLGRPPISFNSSSESASVHGVASFVRQVLHEHPPELRNVLPEVCKPLSEIVSKLLAKDPKERYGSGFGLWKDCEAALAALRACSTPALWPAIEVPLFGSDVPTEPLWHVQGCPVGRESEWALLTHAAKQCGDGRNVLIQFTGSQHMGRSTLADALVSSLPAILPSSQHSPAVVFTGVSRCAGNFAPYSSLSAVLSSLLGSLSAADLITRTAAHTDIKSSVGSKAVWLMSVLPVLRPLLDEGGAKHSLSSSCSADDVDHIVRQGVLDLLCAVAAHCDALAVVVDNITVRKRLAVLLCVILWLFFTCCVVRWQMCDTNSLKVYQQLVRLRTPGAVLFAYTDEEGAGSYDLISQSSWFTFRLELQPLTKPAITKILATTCMLPSVDALACTEAVYSFTHGNPALVMRALRTLYEQGVLHLDAFSGRWTLDPTLAASALARMGSDGFDASAALTRLSPEARSVVCVAACIGLTVTLDEVRVGLWLNPPKFGCLRTACQCMVL
jgi:hypothetical protein